MAGVLSTWMQHSSIQATQSPSIQATRKSYASIVKMEAMERLLLADGRRGRISTVCSDDLITIKLLLSRKRSLKVKRNLGTTVTNGLLCCFQVQEERFCVHWMPLSLSVTNGTRSWWHWIQGTGMKTPCDKQQHSMLLHMIKSRDSSVGIVAGYWLDGQGEQIFLYSKMSWLPLEHTSASYFPRR
jgi:hypothetical protein